MTALPLTPEERDELLRFDTELSEAAYRKKIYRWEATVVHFEERHQVHLELIRNLSLDSVTPAEAEELRGQIASLIAEVGTLRHAQEELSSIKARYLAFAIEMTGLEVTINEECCTCGAPRMDCCSCKGGRDAD